MTDILKDWVEVGRRMQKARALAILISCDEAGDAGTGRRFPQEGRERLQALAALDRVSIAVHGGETLRDLVAAVGLIGIWYVANRGFEIQDPQGKVTQFFGPDEVRLIDRIQDELLLQTSHVAGVRLVHRGPRLALVYEEVDPPQVSAVLDIFRSAVGPFLPQVVAVHGSKTIEARVRTAFDEKTALRYVHRRFAPGSLLFYFGADPTLLQMFEDLRPAGILVEVGGAREPSARYRVPGLMEVIDVLGRIATQWQTRGDSP